VSAYQELNVLVDYFACWNRLEFDERAAEKFDQLRGQKIRIGTMDLRIAAIALVHNATLLSANRKDFQQIPSLHVEDWLVP
jgi:tRNA(fMet)-specific endonuclease VapC